MQELISTSFRGMGSAGFLIPFQDYMERRNWRGSSPPLTLDGVTSVQALVNRLDNIPPTEEDDRSTPERLVNMQYSRHVDEYFPGKPGRVSPNWLQTL